MESHLSIALISVHGLKKYLSIASLSVRELDPHLLDSPGFSLRTETAVVDSLFNPRAAKVAKGRVRLEGKGPRSRRRTGGFRSRMPPTVSLGREGVRFSSVEVRRQADPCIMGP